MTKKADEVVANEPDAYPDWNPVLKAAHQAARDWHFYNEAPRANPNGLWAFYLIEALAEIRNLKEEVDSLSNQLHEKGLYNDNF